MCSTIVRRRSVRIGVGKSSICLAVGRVVPGVVVHVHDGFEVRVSSQLHEALGDVAVFAFRRLEKAAIEIHAAFEVAVTEKWQGLRGLHGSDQTQGVPRRLTTTRCTTWPGTRCPAC